MNELLVTPFLSPQAMGLPPGTLCETVTFTMTDNLVDIPEIVFAICNSYPEEMFCKRQYADMVTEYRAKHFRSLSVGDYVRISTPLGAAEWWYQVDRFGFKEIDYNPLTNPAV